MVTRSQTRGLSKEEKESLVVGGETNFPEPKKRKKQSTKKSQDAAAATTTTATESQKAAPPAPQKQPRQRPSRPTQAQPTRTATTTGTPPPARARTSPKNSSSPTSPSARTSTQKTPPQAKQVPPARASLPAVQPGTSSDVEDSPENKKRRPRVDIRTVQKGLELTNKRLTPYSYKHLPVAEYNASTTCQLHRYLMKTQIQGHVSQCITCGVALCAKCYRPFHVVLELHKWEKNIEGLYEYCRVETEKNIAKYAKKRKK